MIPETVKRPIVELSRGVANFVGLPESLATEITEKILRKASKNSVYSVA